MDKGEKSAAGCQSSHDVAMRAEGGSTQTCTVSVTMFLQASCAQELEVSEFVLSNELVSMALAMVAENPEVNDILSELFTPDGNELYVHPASRYLRCAPTFISAYEGAFLIQEQARHIGVNLEGRATPLKGLAHGAQLYVV